MARLNEVPVPVESVEALKRRFIRQNRELAKNNSTQHIRIRCLEAEISRLLSENLGLREEIIQLRNEVENQPNLTAVGSVRDQLAFKIQELGDLVMALGQLQESGSASKKSPSDTPSKRSPRATRNWRPGLDVLDEQEGRLPTIREDKYYPRRTLEYVLELHKPRFSVIGDFADVGSSADEIRKMAIEAANDSPDLGPPPVSHFQDEDPIKFDPQREPTEEQEQQTTEDDKDSEALPAALSVNLETRRKRRDSSSKLNLKRVAVFHSPPERPDEDASRKSEQVPPIRAGSKRKLGAREEEAKSESNKPTACKEEFKFNRRSAAVRSGDAGKAARTAAEKPALTSSASSDRRALGEKAVNTDPVLSPKKLYKRSVLVDEKASLKKPGQQPKDSTNPRSIRERKSKTSGTEPLSVQILSEPLVDSIDVVELPPTSTVPPKTPASLDLFSPTPSLPSTSRPATKDTPPPSDLRSAPNGQGMEPAGRAGRRARAPVNYAEPSLVSKMRRPTKELFDAVGKDGRPVSGSIVQKREHSDDEGVVGESWKQDGEPSTTALQSHTLDSDDFLSPLGGKSAAPKAIMGQSEDDNDNDEYDDPISAPTGTERSASSAAISALIHGTSVSSKGRKSSRKSGLPTATLPLNSAIAAALPVEEEEEEIPALATASKILSTPAPGPLSLRADRRASLSIFDFTETSPGDDIAASGDPKLLARSRPRVSSRRHSSMSEMRGGSGGKVVEAASSGNGSGVETVVGESLRVVRRAKAGSEAEAGGLAASTVAETLGRSERAAARRKSMML